MEFLTRAGCAICVRVAEQLAVKTRPANWASTHDDDRRRSQGADGIQGCELSLHRLVVLLDGRELIHWERRLRGGYSPQHICSPPDKRLP